MTNWNNLPEHSGAQRTTTEVVSASGTGQVAVTAADAVLELKLIGDIAGSFRVARYQRGYRWGMLEVGRLLNDVWENGDKDYSLQPVVVKRDAGDVCGSSSTASSA